jgi:hypothetical protein
VPATDFEVNSLEVNEGQTNFCVLELHAFQLLVDAVGSPVGAVGSPVDTGSLQSPISAQLRLILIRVRRSYRISHLAGIRYDFIRRLYRLI